MSAVLIGTGYSTVRNRDTEKETDGAQKTHFQSTDTTLKQQEDGVDSHEEHIGPIARLNSDVLAVMFEFSGEVDWKAPLSISRVCREWRLIILTTPRAWANLHLPEKPPSNLISLYVTRSQPLLLHISTPWCAIDDPRNQMYLDVINRNSDRIECLSITPEHLHRLTSPFPYLRQLDLGDEYAFYVDLGSLQCSRFPSLSQLKVPNFNRPLSSATINPPPVQVLTIGTDKKGVWLKILTMMEKTLVTLRIEAYSDDDWLMPTRPLDFPLLKYLEIIPSQNPIPFIITAKTPSLRTYFVYMPIDEPFQVEVDIALITHLHLADPVDLALYPMVRHLRIGFHPDEIVEMIELNPGLCPHLKDIQYKSEEEEYRWSLEWEIQGKERRVEMIPCASIQYWKVAVPGQYPEPVSIP
jgi:hypothetical protein